MRILQSIFILALMSLAGCASNLGYVAAEGEEAYGYTDEALSEQRYRVAFNGKRMLNNNRLADYTIRRAAEVTLANGYDWFRVADPEATVGEVQPDSAPKFVKVRAPGPSGFDARFRQQLIAKTNSAKPDSRAEVLPPVPAIEIEIVVGKGMAPLEALVFDARSVLGIVETI